MSEPIKAGDLVMVVRLSPCCRKARLGFPFTVLDVRIAKGKYHCWHCKATLPKGLVASYGKNSVVALWRLKKIDPTAEQTDTETRKELTA